MKRFHSEPDLRDMENVKPTKFMKKIVDPDYSNRRTAEIVADLDIEDALDEIEHTPALTLKREMSNFQRKARKITPPDKLDNDFEEMAKKVKQGGKYIVSKINQSNRSRKSRKSRKSSRTRRSRKSRKSRKSKKSKKSRYHK